MARRRNKSTAPTDTAADAIITIEDGSGMVAPGIVPTADVPSSWSDAVVNAGARFEV